ncbi:MAG: hypothetical protein A2X56_08240 [Nitrospirae bacterium GWC2_57_13]|jgi:hypothetical protein|nr:MAG: hypothetical protein A2072_08365 [Nitrospirae bacterium GWC1_57_7]OGW27679.1 MAG: hypothetical protein A2X56_08240 [Nitrospirae bacterium GWC2_57_13]OGW45234.1 MAG: hypothetical protein A2X57_00845 [Nitrospirae bacterium GWD2_57_8]HAR46008.1 hypothetical protein [Nitrospiraceae bacterium]HAS52991.1 hypothetical protein [Nitrospiraceae bacterium]
MNAQFVDALLIAGGIYHAGFVVFHAMFWKFFFWKYELETLSTINRGVMQILNLCLIFVFLAFAYLSFAHRSDLTATPLGRALLLIVSIFWLLRAIEQAIFFGLKKRLSLILFTFFVAGTLLYFFLFMIGISG